MSVSINRALCFCVALSFCFPSLAYATKDKSHHGYVELSFLWYIGEAQGDFECQIPPTDQGTTDALCHEHVLLDLKRDRPIGVAIDSAADIAIQGEGLVATGTTTFNLERGRFAGSSLQVRGKGTIQPFLAGTPLFDWKSRSFDSSPIPVTHIAGTFPNGDENMVLSGSGIFKDATGTFAMFGGAFLDFSTGESSCNCVVKLDLKVPRSNFYKRPFK